MIKKILLGLGITFLSFIGFSSADFSIGNIANIGTYIDTLGGNKITVLKNGILNSTNSDGTISKNILVFSDTNYTNATNKKYFRFNNGYAYFYWYLTGYSYTNNLVAGKFTKYFLCDPLNGSTVSNCSVNDYGNGSSLINFFRNIDITDKYGFKVKTTNQNTLPLIVCFSSDSYGKSVCFDNSSDSYYDSIYMVPGLSFDIFPLSSIGNPPGIQNGGDNGGGSSFEVVGITPGSIESALNYYENHYGWDSSICYAGVDSLNYLYGQNGVSYTPGSGLSIFQVYEGLYGNENNKNDFLLYTSRWLNSWLINYHERFDTGGDPSWLAYYNSGTHLVDYQFDNLGFPFANQPVAFYFLTDNIQGQTEQITQGEEVVSYCNIKINSGTYDEIIGSANKYNINSYTEQGNTNVGLNPDGTKHEYTGAFLGSGVDLAFSGNVSIKNTLKNFFDKLNDSISINSVPGVIAILPDWLVVAFLTIILFKFFRKKS